MSSLASKVQTLEEKMADAMLGIENRNRLILQQKQEIASITLNRDGLKQAYDQLKKERDAWHARAETAEGRIRMEEMRRINPPPQPRQILAVSQLKGILDEINKAPLRLNGGMVHFRIPTFGEIPAGRIGEPVDVVIHTLSLQANVIGKQDHHGSWRRRWQAIGFDIGNITVLDDGAYRSMQ